MNQQTVSALNQINHTFYAKVADHFSSSREYDWLGWERIWKTLEPKPKRILDLGCGNGRFYEFLQKQNVAVDYLGVDSSSELLAIARSKYPQARFEQMDLLDLTALESDSKFDLIVIFGVMHHIPGYENRAQLLKHAKNLLAPNGHIALSFWNFLEDERLQKKVIAWPAAISQGQIPDIDLGELEKNDYLLDWQRGTTAYRYCHHCTADEITKLLAAAGFDVELNFTAEGKSQKLNSYYILRSL